MTMSQLSSMLTLNFIPIFISAVVTAKHKMKIIKRAKQTDVQKR